jgi:very-short-patch-repair endonuclease
MLHSHCMTARRPLPPDLPTPAFRVDDAGRAGVPGHRLRAADLNREVTGIRSRQHELSLAERCGLYQLRLAPTSFFSHSTAALLHSIPVPFHLAHGRLVHISLPAPHRAPHARGIAGHSLQVEPHELMTLPNGLRVTTPLRTWFDLAHELGLLDLVAAGDALIHWRHPLVSPLDLAEALGRPFNRRIRRKLRHAGQLLNDRSESPPESILRALLELAGLTISGVNHVVTDQFGEFVARTDLIIDRHRIILEYQGDYHRTKKGQWRADMSRRAKLEAQGWRVMELNADDLKDPAELVDRIRALAQLPRLESQAATFDA